MTQTEQEVKDIANEAVLARYRLEVHNLTLRLKNITAMCNTHQTERADYIHCGFWKNPLDSQHADELAACISRTAVYPKTTTTDGLSQSQTLPLCSLNVTAGFKQ